MHCSCGVGSGGRSANVRRVVTQNPISAQFRGGPTKPDFCSW